MESESKQARLAVLIDADNAQPSLAEALLAEIAKYGIASVKRIYGDWTQPNLRGWKDQLAAHAIQPMQQFGYTTGKNSTDGALIIDAMDLLFSGRFDGFCIVSSDSDFTGLAMRIRQAGLAVYGFGEKKTPKAFVSACDKFIDVEVLRAPSADEPATPPRDNKALKQDKKLVRLIRDALEASADDDGWAGLGAVGSLITKQAPDFDPRNYGFRKLSELLPAIGLFEIDKRGVDGKQKSIYLREKGGAAKKP